MRLINIILVIVYAVLILIFTCGCASIQENHINQCVLAQTDLYGDLCAESSTGYESMAGSDAHYEGVKCGAESVAYCLGVGR